MVRNIRFIGDVHGYTDILEDVVQNRPEGSETIQVGDMGVGFGQGDYWHNKLDGMLESNDCRFIRGNHDNPHKCKEMKSWIQDGTIEDDIFFCGGAWSIDQRFRTLGVDYWSEEELSFDELYRVVELYSMARPRIVVTHEFPYDAASKMFFENPECYLFGKSQIKTRTGLSFESMFASHKPNLWIGGHYHCDIDMTIAGTRFICLNELSYIDVDVETLEIEKGS